MLLQGNIKLTELETSDRAKDHVVHIPYIHPHSHIHSLKLHLAVTVVFDVISQDILLPSSAGSQVLGLCLYRSLHF